MILTPAMASIRLAKADTGLADADAQTKKVPLWGNQGLLLCIEQTARP